MSSLRTKRQEAGLTQQQLADRAGVSRQLVGAVEAGRHLPRVDAALALAAALDVAVDALFAAEAAARDVVTGAEAPDGSLVRVGRVGDQTVTAAARIGPEGWDIADGIVNEGRVSLLGRRAPGIVVVGCEPGLEAVERILRERGMGAVAASASSQSAVEALRAGRAHAAVVHGPALADGSVSAEGVERFGLTSWRVGLAGPPDAPADWWRAALSGKQAVIQREDGAGVQRTFTRFVDGDKLIPGPRVGNHVRAATQSILTGLAAVTIEPAALAMGARFHPLDVHVAELWIASEWLRTPLIAEAIDVISSRRFQSRLAAIGGYDLTGCGTRVA